MLNVMAVAREEISYGEFRGIFGESDEENNETLDADASDFDEDIFVRNSSDSEGETSEDEGEEDEWYNACDLTFETLNSEIEPPRGSPDYDKLFKVRPILSKVVKTIQRAYYPGQNISVDEAMIAFRGRLSFPTKYGIKVWVAADSENGYVANTSIYQGTGRTYVHGQGYDVLMSMAKPS